MKKFILFVSLIMLSFSVSAGQLCTLSFSHDHKMGSSRMDEGSFYHELWIAGVKQSLKIVDKGPNIRTDVKWWSNEPCPPCTWLRLRTIHVVSGASEWSDSMCYRQPNKPDACQ